MTSDARRPGSRGLGDEGRIDVIVPVYGAPEALERCLASLERHVDRSRHRLLLVVDGPQEEAVELLVARARERFGAPALDVLRQEVRSGYPAAIHRGLLAGEVESGGAGRDVVLLNSDTVVTRGWLDRLAAAAASAPRIGTVTPFTNNGTLASLPRPFEINRLPTGFDVDRFAALVEQSSARLYPRIPTAVGFCFYVKRALLSEIGSFDRVAFGLGYGEEVDFCLRAAAAGWEHCLDDATFVFHEGQRSFGRTRDRRVRQAERTLARRYPDFRARLAAWMTEDPVAPARRPILEALRSASAPPAGRSPAAPPRAAVVHLVHGWPPENFAGTEMYAWWLAHQQRASRPVAVYTRSADRQFATGTVIELDDLSIRVRARVNHFDQRNPLRRNGLYDRGARVDFARFLDQTAPDLLHIHHLAGNGFALVDEARRRRLPLVLQLQDWWLLCARANLLDRDRRLCPGPTPGRCSACLPLTRLTPSAGLNGRLNRALYRIRDRRARSVLAAADALVAGSSAILDSFRALGWLPDRVPVHLVPYGVEHPSRPIEPLPRVPGLPLRLGFIGSLLPHKGLHVATRALAGLPASAVTLEVWGDAAHDPDYVREAVAAAEGGAVHLRGRFAEEERGAIYAGLDLLLVPSLGLESYSLAAREALAAGLPVVASRRGALAELFVGAEACGGQFDPDRPEELRAWLERLIADPRQIADWRRHAPAVPTLAGHFAALEPIYDQVLAARRSR
ncbi:MAG: glycosyltransferase [Thermoanaerobaculia bacterium]|nr:glycosyltransferase [Thermoanaerobaculia bacterium]